MTSQPNLGSQGEPEIAESYICGFDYGWGKIRIWFFTKNYWTTREV
jgi:hypothetical protein